MSSYFNYIRESRGMNVVAGAYGFATYLINGEECYVEDVYVEPDFRRTGIGSEFIDRLKIIAKEKKCKALTTTVGCRIKDPEVSLISCLNVGFKVFSAVNDTIFLRMEI